VAARRWQGRSRRYNFSTDAGHRFERGVDPSLTVEHIEHITRLIIEICGGEAGPMDDQVSGCRAATGRLRVARAAKVIGMPVTQEQCVDALSRLGLPVTARGGRAHCGAAAVPFRPEQIEEDLIEEVVRVIGYEQLPTRRRWRPSPPKLPTENRGAAALRCVGSWLRWATRKRSTSASSRSLGARAGRQPRPDPAAQPDRQPDERDALVAARLAAAGARFNLDRKAERVRVFELGRVFRAMLR
jgi:phenylalanyl-tRNA synthetase beta chain